MHISSVAYESDILSICKTCFSFNYKVSIRVSSFLSQGLVHFINIFNLVRRRPLVGVTFCGLDPPDALKIMVTRNEVVTHSSPQVF